MGKSCDKDNRKLELTGKEWSKHPTAVSHASIPTVNDSNNEKAQMQMKATLGLCCHQLGRMVSGMDAANLSSSPWIQRASSAPAPSGLPSDYDRGLGSGRDSVIP